MTKESYGLNYLLNNMESNMELLPYVVEIEFNMTIEEFTEEYIMEDEQGFYCNI
jgi:hypothetical protein